MPSLPRSLFTTFALFSLLGAFTVLPGCGGGGANPGGEAIAMPMGQVRVSVIWPSSTGRLIPSNARSIRLEVRSGAQVVGTALIARPAAAATISDVPIGSHSVHAIAYESTDGTGVPLAIANVPAAVSDGGTTTVSLILASTIDHLEFAPNPLVIGAGMNLPLIVSAKDAQGNTVLLDPGALTFVSSNTGLLTVAADGTLTAGSVIGSATITATETNSGQSLTIPATIAVGVSVSPASLTLNASGGTPFSATVIGALNTSVTWSVREANAGTITSGGVYIAPTRRGIYHVEATSVADPTRKAVATVTVTSGSIQADVQ